MTADFCLDRSTARQLPAKQVEVQQQSGFRAWVTQRATDPFADCQAGSAIDARALVARRPRITRIHQVIPDCQ